MGDDWNDVPVMRKVAWAGVPTDVFPRIQEEADFISTRRGGDGAVREFIEFILKEQGRFDEAIDAFLARLTSL
jgi:3-deoxy-D-manno-octulosonate 8-phosphate phosphatase (KDO 8-P phosphatase)